MLFVRNPTGVSHSPAEYAELADCLAGVEALAAVLDDLAGEAGRCVMAGTPWHAELAWLGDGSPPTCSSRSTAAGSPR